jgi:exodeoxyribonuclease III
MLVVSFNVNGVRARMHQLAALTELHEPDIIALQETKVADEQFPLEDLQALGYPYVNYYGQKGHYGVALLSRIKPESVTLGVPWREEAQQRRLISARYPGPGGQALTVLNGYFPQGESRDHPTKFPAKELFYKDLQRILEETFTLDDALLVVGDMNVAPEDSDIGIGEDNRKRWLRTGKCSFLPEEREWLEQLLAWGLIDTYASQTKPDDRLYSWFDYRSRGFEQDPKRGLRIDLILASTLLAARVQETGIDYHIRALDKPSDHCPVWVRLSD